MPEPKDVYDLQLSRMSVKDVIRDLEKFGLSTAGCVEVSDFKQLLREAWQKRDSHFEDKKRKEEQRAEEDRRRRELRAAQEKIEKMEHDKREKENSILADRIVKEVDMWSKNKSLHTMLNEVNGELESKPTGLKKYDNAANVNKAYKRALLKIHPDKHMDDHGKFVRATEMFKCVNEAYQQWKKKNGSM